MSKVDEELHALDTSDAYVVFEALQKFPELQAKVPIPALQTADDLLHWVKADETRNGNQRSNECAAIKWLGKIDDTPLSAIPLDVRYIVDHRYKLIRGKKEFTKRRKSDIVTLANRVLKRAGILSVGTKRCGDLTLTWHTLLETRSLYERANLSTFARYCSELGIEPAEVTLAVWQAFSDETLHQSSIKKPRATLQGVINSSNSARKTRPDWPLPEFPKLVNPRKVSLPEDQFPASLWVDFDNFAKKASIQTADIFDNNSYDPLSPDTLERYRYVVQRTASAQVYRGRPAAEIVDLATLTDVHWLKEAMRWFYAHAGDKYLKDHANIAAAWVSFAKRYVLPPSDVLEVLRADIMFMILEKLGPQEFSQRNIEKLDQFNDEDKANALLLLPFRIFDEVRQKKVITVEDATLMMAAVGIELLLATMVRRKNLAWADISKNFWPAKPRADGTWTFRVKGESVKNKQDLDFKLSKSTTRLIQFYLTECWPLLVKKPTTQLFLRTDGAPKGRSMMANLIVTTVRKRLGLEVNMHLFRHIGAMLFLEAHPGSLEVVRIMLGHKRIETTEKFYARLKAEKAMQLFAEVVLGKRDLVIDQLKLGRRKKT